MTIRITNRGLQLQDIHRTECFPLGLKVLFAFLIAWLVIAEPMVGETAVELRRTLTVTMSQNVMLDIDIPSGELDICYGREGVVSISAAAQAPAGGSVDNTLLSALINVEQSGNHITIRHLPSPVDFDDRMKVRIRIDVPYRTELSSKLGSGKQTITGLLGPVRAETNRGDVTVAYISNSVRAQVGTGNLDIQVVGDHVEADAGTGNISCARLARGVRAKTADGDITLLDVGSSSATVQGGNGRIEVGGAKGGLVGSTAGGDLHVKAIPHADWNLTSVSGKVRLELPPAAGFELEASTKSGELRFDREDLGHLDSNTLPFHQSVNGGGKRITVHTESGTIALQ